MQFVMFIENVSFLRNFCKKKITLFRLLLYFLKNRTIKLKPDLKGFTLFAKHTVFVHCNDYEYSCYRIIS